MYYQNLKNLSDTLIGDNIFFLRYLNFNIFRTKNLLPILVYKLAQNERNPYNKDQYFH